MTLSQYDIAQQTERLLRRRWLVWAVLAFCFAIVFFHRVSLAVVSDQLMAEFNLGAAALGNLGAVYFYVYTAMQIPSGILADTTGPRLTVTAGMLLAAMGAAVFALAQSLAVATAGRFLTGLGVSVVFVSVQKAQTFWSVSYTHLDVYKRQPAKTELRTQYQFVAQFLLLSCCLVFCL